MKAAVFLILILEMSCHISLVTGTSHATVWIGTMQSVSCTYLLNFFASRPVIYILINANATREKEARMSRSFP